ncbi:MAG: hypothetical protein HYW07_18835 [Candidatus Latescibacteria bacterium]|nr:hypothetical protein [Candidatus Latescibacterota bacterium]
MPSIVHITHEAIHASGGISSVLKGLITARAYAQRIGRTLLLGPLTDPQGPDPLGAGGAVVYDQARGIWSGEVGPALSRVEIRWGVRLVYGWRTMDSPSGRVGAEVLLVDVSHPPHGFNDFKYYLSQRFGLDSRRHEGTWEYEQYLRLAEPGLDGVRALLGEDQYPCFLIAHEFMGLGTVFKAILEGDRRLATIFYAHEVATARLITESHPGHDVMFYNALRAARREGVYMDEVFGSQDGYFKHALVRQAWRCDGLFAVGDWVVEELRFLGPQFARRQLDLVYNGVPAAPMTLGEKNRARGRLQEYAQGLLGWAPNLVFTHVARLVTSKGLWRDLMVLERLDPLLASQGRNGIFIVLATESGRRAAGDVASMAGEYGWPLVHREGHPDLSGREVDFDLLVRTFNARSRALKVLFVNQFGWDQASCGPAMSPQMGFADLRLGSDAEFGLSIYEPFGIAQVEPLSYGAISVVSEVCGCAGFVKGTGTAPTGFIQGAYTRLERAVDWRGALALEAEHRHQAELRTSRELAAALAARLPSGPREAERLLDEGYRTASRMSWERVVQEYLLPALQRIAPPG